MDSLKRQKQALRKSILKELKNLSAQQKTKESAILRTLLVEWISKNCPRGSVIATYAGLSFEPDLLGLHQLLPQYRFAYPRCDTNRSLHFHVITNPDEQLIKGYYGIREPREDNSTEVSIDEIALFIVPAVAYTINGHRLGKGGGYYDRILAGVSIQTPLLGAGFSTQIKEHIPVENHDISVNHVISTM